MPISHASTIDKLMDYIPDVIEKANKIVNKKMDSKDKKEQINHDDVTIKTTETNKSPNKREKVIKVEYDENNPTEYLEDE